MSCAEYRAQLRLDAWLRSRCVEPQQLHTVRSTLGRLSHSLQDHATDDRGVAGHLIAWEGRSSCSGANTLPRACTVEASTATCSPGTETAGAPYRFLFTDPA